MKELRDLITELPEGIRISDLQSVMDVPLLTADGEKVPGMLLSTGGRTVMFLIQLATQIENLEEANLAEIITIAQDGAKGPVSK